MPKPLLSIVIPAYNVELFLEETVLSIASSKYSSENEILIVNDGSTDGTKNVAEKLATQYHCVKIINKSNGGHGSTINTVITTATGKYFRLLEGDDWFETQEFDKYIELLKKEDSDIIFTDLMECFIKSDLKQPVTYYTHLPAYKTVHLDEVSFPEWGPMLPTTTIKTKLLQNFGLKLDEHCFYVDQEYNLACYLSAKTATYYPLMIYQYRLERDGQSMEKSSLIRNVSSHEKVCARLLREYHKHCPGISKNKQDYIRQRMIIPMCHMQYYIAVDLCKSKKHFLSFDAILHHYPEFYNDAGIAGTLIRFYRKTKGELVALNPAIDKSARLKSQLVSRCHLNKSKLLIMLGFIAAIIIANAIVINYVQSEQTFYYWDLSGYWKNSIDLIDTFNNSWGSGIKTILASLNTDYNYLPLVPMLPFLAIFGNSRLVFILTTLNLYIVPFALIMYLTVKKMFVNTRFKIRTWVKPFIFAIFLLLPAILIPVLNGRPDAICLIFIAAIFYLLAKTRLECISNYFVLGLLTFLLILFRRYFSFWGVSMYVSILIVKTILNLKKYGFNKTALIKSIKISIKLFISGLFLLLLMLIVARGLLVRYLTGNYGDAYSGYLLGDFFNQILLFIRYHGAITLILALAGIVCIRRYRNTAISEVMSLGIISSTLSFVLFTRVQTLGDQHMYMVVPFLGMSIAVLIVRLSEARHGRILSMLPVLIIFALSLYSFTGTRTNCDDLCYIIGGTKMFKPTVRNDTDTIKSIYSDLQQSMSDTDYVYILASSDNFNDDLFRNIYLPKQTNLNISGVCHVDKRDGFPYYFFDATYIIVADPIQTHLAPGSQEVITYLAKQILDGKANNLSLIKTYNIDNDITLNVYHKEHAYDTTFLQSTKQYFYEKYKDYPFLYDTIPTHN